MSASLYLSMRLNYLETRRVPVSGFNLDQKVFALREYVSKEVQSPPGEIALVYRGILLNDDTTLSAAGVLPGTTVIVLTTVPKAPEPSPEAEKPNVDSGTLLAIYKNAAKNPNYRSALQRLCRPEVLENIIAATPGLREDPFALAVLEDHELLSQLITAQTVSRVMETHPALADAAHTIIAMVHEEAANSISTQTPVSYALDALSDDDDNESSQSSDSQPQTRDSSFGAAITTGQLAAALAAAQARAQSSQPGDSAPATPGPITSEMFNQALGQAFASTTGTPNPPAQSSQPTPRTRADLTDLEATSRRLAEHLQQMRELGLRDDTLNLQALQATDWNVQEAINLVFSGVMSDINDPDPNDSME